MVFKSKPKNHIDMEISETGVILDGLQEFMGNRRRG
jgi:hypothetical protein